MIAFKEHEFKKCNDAGFCRRNRGKALNKFWIDQVAVSGSTVSAIMMNSAAPGHLYSFALTAYADGAALANVTSVISRCQPAATFVDAHTGFVRLTVDEQPGVGRYRITDIISPEVENKKGIWVQTSRDAQGAVFSISELQATLTLTFAPLRISVSSHGKPVLVFNSRDMFSFEHRRKREVRASAYSSLHPGPLLPVWPCECAALCAVRMWMGTATAAGRRRSSITRNRSPRAQRRCLWTSPSLASTTCTACLSAPPAWP